MLGPTQSAGYSVYFWVCVFVIFMVGSYVQDRLKNITPILYDGIRGKEDGWKKRSL